MPLESLIECPNVAEKGGRKKLGRRGGGEPSPACRYIFIPIPEQLTASSGSCGKNAQHVSVVKLLHVVCNVFAANLDILKMQLHALYLIIISKPGSARCS